MLFRIRYIKYFCMFLLSIGIVQAQENTPPPVFISPFSYYTGFYQCDVVRSIIHLKTHYEGNIFIAEVATRNFNETTSHIVRYSALVTDEPNLILESKDSPLKIQVPTYLAPEKNSWKWIEPEGSRKQCFNFELNKNAPSINLYQDVISQLKNNEISLNEAKNLAKLQNERPPFDFLPKENQQDIIKQYNEANIAYWAKYYANISDEFQNFPLDTKKQIESFYSALEKALSLFLYPYAYNTPNNKDYANALLLLVNDRINAMGKDVVPIGERDAKAICLRYILQPHDTIKDFENIFVIAADYIKPQLEQNGPYNLQILTTSLQSCSTPNIVAKLKAIWPEIEKRADNGQYVLQQVKKLQNTAENIEAYKNSNFLQLNRDEIKKRGISPEIIERLVGDKLKEKKAHMQQTLHENINASFVTNADLAEFTKENINSHCQNLLEYNSKDQSPLKDLYQQCQNIGQQRADSLVSEKIQTVIDVAANSKVENNDAVDILINNQWLDSKLIAAPLDINKDYLPKLQKELARLQISTINNAEKNIHDNFAKINIAEDKPAILDSCAKIEKSTVAALASLKNICQQEIKTYSENRKKYQCDEAVEQANLPQSMLNKNVYFDLKDTGEKIKLRSLICRLGLHHTSTQVKETGQWLSSNYYIEFQQKNTDGTDLPMQKAILTPMRDGLRLVNILGTSTMHWIKSLNILEKS